MASNLLKLHAFISFNVDKDTKNMGSDFVQHMEENGKFVEDDKRPPKRID